MSADAAGDGSGETSILGNIISLLVGIWTFIPNKYKEKVIDKVCEEVGAVFGFFYDKFKRRWLTAEEVPAAEGSNE